MQPTNRNDLSFGRIVRDQRMQPANKNDLSFSRIVQSVEGLRADGARTEPSNPHQLGTASRPASPSSSSAVGRPFHGTICQTGTRHPFSFPSNPHGAGQWTQKLKSTLCLLYSSPPPPPPSKSRLTIQFCALQSGICAVGFY